MPSNPSSPIPESDCNEFVLRRDFRKVTEGSFDIREEVPGIHRLENVRVKADLLCYPNEALIARGFPSGWFVIETKRLDFAAHESKRFYEAFWQSVSYQQSEFIIDGKTIQPVFTALVVNHQPNQRENAVFQAQKRRWQILKELGVYANVGFFNLNAHDGWELLFGQARFFHSARGLNSVPRGLRKYVGSRAIDSKA